MKMNVNDEISSFLKEKDPLFVDLIDRYGRLEIELQDNIFEAIIYNIIGQMLSKKASDTVFNRFAFLCNNIIDADRIASLTRDDLRKCGMSYSKADYILKFSREIINNKHNLYNLNEYNEDQVIDVLRKIDGVGLWTAEMIALFSLGKENIFSYNDIALKNGIIKAKGFKTLSKKRFEMLRKKYTPYCSYASLYFYKINDDKEFDINAFK